jgi:hypothetical protein
MLGVPFQGINVTGKVDFVTKEGRIYEQPIDETFFDN